MWGAKAVCWLMVMWAWGAGAQEKPLEAPPPETIALPALGPTDPLAQRPKREGPLRLKEAVEIALKESPLLRGALEELRAAAAQVEMARAMRRPMLSANAFLSGGTMGMVVSNPAFVSPSTWQALPRGRFGDLNLMLMVPLFTGGRLESLIRQAEAARSATLAQVEAMRLDVALETRLAYWRALFAQELVRVAQAYIAAMEERVRIDREAAEVGRIPAFWVLRSEAELANARQMLTNAQRDAEVALIELKAIMGLHPDSAITLEETLTFEPWEEKRDPLLAEALSQRPELEQLQRRLQEGEAKEKAVRALYRPQVALALSAEAMRSPGMGAQGGSLVGVAIGLPVLDGGWRQSSMQEARAVQEQARWSLEQARLQVAREVDSALRELQAAAQNVRTAEVALKAAEADLEVAKVRYEAGRSVLVEYLDALFAFVRARTNWAQALYEHATAREKLLRALGRRP